MLFGLSLNILKPIQNDRHYTGDNSKYIYLNENVSTLNVIDIGRHDWEDSTDTPYFVFHSYDFISLMPIPPGLKTRVTVRVFITNEILPL